MAAVLEAKPGNEAAWRQLSLDDLRVQPGFFAAVALWKKNGAPTPQLDTQKDFNGAPEVCMYFDGLFLGFAGDLICNKENTLGRLRAMHFAQGDPGGIDTVYVPAAPPTPN